MSLLKTVCFCLCPCVILHSRLCLTRYYYIITYYGLSLSRSPCMRVCVRARVRGQLLFTGAGKTIMEKYLWSTSVAHQQMIIKPGPGIRSSGRPATTAPPFVSHRERSRSLHIILYYNNSRVNVCLCVGVCVCVCV